HATDRAETPPHKIPVHLAREPHQRMAWIDELLQGRLKQIVLTIVARLAHGLPQQRISLSSESWRVKIGNPKMQENLHPHPAFLQNRILAQTKSARSIKHFRILHGRLLDFSIANDGCYAFCFGKDFFLEVHSLVKFR